MTRWKYLAGVLAATAILAIGLALPALRPGSGGAPPLEGAFDDFRLSDPPVPAPVAGFVAHGRGGAGSAVTLGDFAGRVVLLNFWATWCAPCVREMGSLDRLQSALAHRGLAVVAVSEDRGGLEQVAPFYREQGLDALEIYLDPEGGLRRAFGIAGLPTTFLIDSEGRLVGELRGAAEWDGPAARALIGRYLE